jgi:hypothetical protein
LRLTISHEKSRESIKKLIYRENYFSFSPMSAKKPDRYGKGMRSVSTTVTAEIYEEMERLAASGGLKVTAWARQALMDSAASGAVYGLKKYQINASEIPQGKAIPQSPPATAGANTLKASANFDSTPSTATTKSSRPAG